MSLLRREWNGVLKVLYGVLVHSHGLNGVGFVSRRIGPGGESG